MAASNDTTKAIVEYLLKRGIGTYDELSKRSKHSRQIIRYWAKKYPRSIVLDEQYEKARKAVTK